MAEEEEEKEEEEEVVEGVPMSRVRSNHFKRKSLGVIGKNETKAASLIEQLFNSKTYRCDACCLCHSVSPCHVTAVT